MGVIVVHEQHRGQSHLTRGEDVKDAPPFVLLARLELARLDGVRFLIRLGLGEGFIDGIGCFHLRPIDHGEDKNLSPGFFVSEQLVNRVLVCGICSAPFIDGRLHVFSWPSHLAIGGRVHLACEWK